jgi:hypothetical protein
MILEGRGAAQFLSVPILTQLLRMSDDALAEFFGRYVSMALDFYQQTRSGMQSFGPFAPFAMPYAASSALARLVGNALPFGAQQPPPVPYASVAPAPPADADDDEPAPPPTATDGTTLDDLVRKLDALEKSVHAAAARQRPAAPATAPARKKPAKKKPPATR